VGRTVSRERIAVIRAIVVLLLASGCTRYVDLSRGDAGSAKPDSNIPLPDAFDTGDAGQGGVDGGPGVDAALHD
jgi:hypothetical protein